MIPELRAVIRNAAKHMTGFKRRRFMAAMAMEHCNGSPRQTETSLGFNRRAVSRGLQELELGETIRNLPERRGRPRIEQQRQDISRITEKILSDTVADNLELWWNERKPLYPHIRTLMIDLDNGPEVSSRRTQFMKRMVAFADKYSLKIELVYYPPYHSKYNAIERCWGVLEQHWNGTLLNSISTTLNWARSMTWKSIHPIVRKLDGIYRRGVKLTKAEFAPIAERLQRSQSVGKWSVVISAEALAAT